ncbi:unnamed protein product [Sphagnum compactum]
MAATVSSAAQLSGSVVSSHFKFTSFEGLTRGRSIRNNNGCCVQQFSSMQHHQAAFIPSLSSSSSSSRRSSCLTIRAATAVAPTFTTLKPLGDRILLKIQAVEEKSAGGILLPSTAQTKPQESAKEKPVIGTVIATGPGTYGEDGERKPVEVSSGDHVLYSKYAGNEFKNKDGVQFVVLRVSDILAILA